MCMCHIKGTCVMIEFVIDWDDMKTRRCRLSSQSITNSIITCVTSKEPKILALLFICRDLGHIKRVLFSMQKTLFPEKSPHTLSKEPYVPYGFGLPLFFFFVFVCGCQMCIQTCGMTYLSVSMRDSKSMHVSDSCIHVGDSFMHVCDSFIHVCD